MKISSGVVTPALVLLLFAVSTEYVGAHGYIASPRSRNYVAYKDGVWSGGNTSTPASEDCPHCANRGGSLARCGLISNRNYDFPANSVGGTLPSNIQATFVKGQEVDLQVVLTAHHKGHFTFNACALESGKTTATQDCFDQSPLEFVKDNLYGAPKDPNYPNRAYLPLLTYPNIQYDSSGVYGSRYSHRFKLPATLVGDVVLIQWHYWTANSCVYPGYNNVTWPAYFFDNGGLPDCGNVPPDGNGVPEQFWNCAEVRILETNTQTAKPISSKPLPATSPVLLPVAKPSPFVAPSLPVVPATSPVTNAVASNCAPSYGQGLVYVAGDQVSSVGNNFRCKPWPYSGWCSGSPLAYAPGTGANWGDAWDLIGACSIGVITSPMSPVKAPVAPVSTQVTLKPVQVPVPVAKPVSKPTVGLKPATNAPVFKATTVPAQVPTANNCAQAYQQGVTYTSGSQVSSGGSNYKCKPWPYSGWCSGSPLAYAPGTGTNWGDAWDLLGACGSAVGTSPPVKAPAAPVMTPVKASVAPISKPVTMKPVQAPAAIPKPVAKPVTLKPAQPQVPTSTNTAVARVEEILDASKVKIDAELFLYQTPRSTWLQSTVYRYAGFIAGIRVMYQTGVASKTFYMGEDSQANGHLYGLVNIAAFLAQSMKETIQYDACDENSWDLVNGKYPLSNACGQLGQSYQDYHCSAEEAHMECPVDKNMRIRAATNAKWYGAPQPLYCGPKTAYPYTGYWDYTAECNMPWSSPPQTCTAYPGQLAGKENNSVAAANNAGRTDVEGCCWWGRGVIQTTGVCNFGKLNYFLGKRAYDEGRPSRYPTIDFCANPESVCDNQDYQELKWIAGFFYWVTSVQEYNDGGWSYIAKLRQFVDGGMKDTSFIDSVSAIVNRGCALPPCPAGPVDGGSERSANFHRALQVLGILP